MVRKDPIWVKTSDFGISKRVLDGETELRTRAGTEGYVAPEIFGLLDDQREDSSYTSAVDIWSLGCLLYYILTKSPPFPTYGSLRDYCWAPSKFPEEPLIARNVGASGRQFIKDFLALEPADRPKASVGLVSRWVIENTTISQPSSTGGMARQPSMSIQGGSSQSERNLDESEQSFINALNPNQLDDDMVQVSPKTPFEWLVRGRTRTFTL